MCVYIYTSPNFSHTKYIHTQSLFLNSTLANLDCLESGTEMVGEEKRHQMMQNLFGDQSEEEEEEEEVESEHESNRQPDYASV